MLTRESVETKIKTYVYGFVCFSTKVLRLAFVRDMTGNSFTAALKGFIWKKGRPRKMHSKCDTDFADTY